MEYLPILGFLLAGYAVIANDSLQTLGTWLNSNKDIKWYWLWAYASVILVGVFIYGQFQGDVAYGRLDKIPYIEPTIWHVLGSTSTSTTYKKRNTCINIILSPISFLHQRL